MGNEELEAIVQKENYDVVAGSAAVDVCLPFSRDRHGRRGGGVTWYIKEALNTTEFRINDNKLACGQGSVGGQQG